MKKIIIIVTLLLTLLYLNNVNAKGYGVGKNIKNERPNCSTSEITNYNGYCIGDDNKNVYLTFDCGYENGYTNKILDVLEKCNVKACFFITGHYLESSTDLVKRMINDGHIIGNHTYSHKDFTKSTGSEILEDVKKLEDEFFNKFNVKMSKFVRPPRGEYNAMSQKLLSENGYTSVFWSLAYVDWHKDSYNGNHYSYNKVMNKIHNGAIILMHTVSKDNSVDLYDIINDVSKEGFIFKTLNDLWYN